MVEDSQNRTATLLFGGLIGFVGGLVVAGVLAIWIYNATPFRAETTPHAKLEPIKPKVEPKADARASTKTEAERKADAERIVPPGPPGSAGVPAKAVVRDEPPKKDTEPAPSAEPRGRLWLQVGAYANRQEAENQRARFAMLRSGAYAQTKGFIIEVAVQLLAEAQSDDEAATMIAHELAHNILGHWQRNVAAGRTYVAIRNNEREADRMAPWLMSNARFEPAAAPRFFANWGPRHGGGMTRSPTHDSWQDRVAAIKAELPEVAAARQGGQLADWRARFPGQMAQ